MSDGFGPEQPPGAAVVWGLGDPRIDPLTEAVRRALDRADRNSGPQTVEHLNSPTNDSLTEESDDPTR